MIEDAINNICNSIMGPADPNDDCSTPNSTCFGSDAVHDMMSQAVGPGPTATNMMMDIQTTMMQYLCEGDTYASIDDLMKLFIDESSYSSDICLPGGETGTIVFSAPSSYRGCGCINPVPRFENGVAVFYSCDPHMEDVLQLSWPCLEVELEGAGSIDSLLDIECP